MEANKELRRAAALRFVPSSMRVRASMSECVCAHANASCEYPCDSSVIRHTEVRALVAIKPADLAILEVEGVEVTQTRFRFHLLVRWGQIF